jgi:predicted Zn-dependent peptidase
MLEHADKMLQVLILSTFALCIAATAQVNDTPAGSPPAVATHVATVEGITEYRLDNGFRFLLYPDPSQQQIFVGITYLVGSRHEGYGEAGMAHLLEHLVFKGTPTHPNIPRELTAYGGSFDATTEHDATHYFESFPADEDNLARTLDLEADRMVNSSISAEDLASVLTVIRNERELRENSPWAILQERVLSTAFLWHNYGNSPIGNGADIENVPMERLRAFYRKYYQPDNAVLVIAGRFHPERAVALVEEKFGRIPPPDRSGANRLYETYTAEPTQDGERTVTLRRVGNVQFAIAAYHVPSASHEQYAAVGVLEHVLGTQPGGRLYKNMVETGLAADTLVDAYALKEPGLLLACRSAPGRRPEQSGRDHAGDLAGRRRRSADAGGGGARQDGIGGRLRNRVQGPGCRRPDAGPIDGDRRLADDVPAPRPSGERHACRCLGRRESVPAYLQPDGRLLPSDGRNAAPGRDSPTARRRGAGFGI